MEKRMGEEGNHGNLKNTPPEIYFFQRHPGLSFHNFWNRATSCSPNIHYMTPQGHCKFKLQYSIPDLQTQDYLILHMYLIQPREHPNSFYLLVSFKNTYYLIFICMYVWLSVCVYMCTTRVQESIEIRRGFRYLGTRDGSHHVGARCLVGTPSLLLQLLHSLRSPIPLSPNPSHSEFSNEGKAPKSPVWHSWWLQQLFL